MAEPLEKPTTEDKPKVEFNMEDLMEVAGAEEALATQPAEQEDELVQKLKGDEKEPAKEPEEKPDEQKEPEPDKEQPERKEPEQQPAQETKSKKEEELEEQLKFYKMLYGDEAERQAYQPEQKQQVQQPTQTEVQQPKSILDNIVVNKEELYDFLSGEPERAGPVLRKFLGTAIILAQQNMNMQQETVKKQTMYIDAVQKTFYQKYNDLNDFRPVVKLAGDQIAAQYEARGVRKYPHEIIDEIGSRARELLQKLATYKAQPQQKRNIPKQGEHGGTKPVAPVQDKRTQQQKEMDDLLIDT